MPKSFHRAALTTLFTVVALVSTPTLAASHLLFKGFNVSDNCLEASVSAAPKGPVHSRHLVLSCSAYPYKDAETLVYDISAESCSTLETFSADSVDYPGSVYVPNTSETGPLESISDGLFLADQHAFLQLEADQGLVQQIGSTVCAPEGSGPPPNPQILAQLDYLKAENLSADDNFGDQIAVSGNTLVIGARLEDGSATMINGSDDDLASNAGAAYVFVRDGNSANWIQQAYLKASNTSSSDDFGRDVDIDGDTIVVGAVREDGATSNTGAAYVFVRNGDTWTEQAVLRASDANTSGRFGYDVAVSGDLIVVGAFSADKAYVFERDPMTGNWSEDIILQGFNTESGDSFGRDVEIEGDTIVVGAFAEDGDGTGISPVDNNDGFRTGAVYVFVRHASNWFEEVYIKASNTDDEDQFGGELSLSGNTLVVGTFHESSDATGINGFQFNNFRPDSGAAYVFVKDPILQVWEQQAYIKASNTGTNDAFGTSVAISGGRLAIAATGEDSNSADDQDNNSAMNSGAVYIFDRDGTEWSQTAYLKASNLDPDDWFGRDLGFDGAIMASGAYREDSGIVGDESDNSAEDSGAAYVFNVPGDDDPGEGTGDCTPDDITLSSQVEVDSFQADHGPCDHVLGQIIISGADIANLDGLSGLTAVYWLQLIGNPLLDDLLGLSSVTELTVIDLFDNFSLTSVDGLGGDTTPGSILLWDNPFLGDLDAFSSVTQLDGSLNLRGSAVLQDLDAFSNLTRVVGVVNIIDNAQLQSIAGLGNVTDFAGTWYVRDNPQLSGLEGIGGQPDLNGLVIWNNDALTHIDELTGLLSVGNIYSELIIRDNQNLQHLDGLADLVGVNAGLDLRDNPNLDDCSALQTLLDDTDDAAPGPGPGGAGIPDLNGDVTISNNLAGCNSFDEIVFGADTEPPVVTAPADIIGVEATAALTPVDLGVAMVTDNSGEEPTTTPDNAGPFPLGDTIVNWSATDSSGNTGTDQQLVKIVDTTTPAVTAPADINVSVTGIMTTVSLGTAMVTDNAGPVASLVNDAPDEFSVGTTIVTWTATDASDNMGTDTQSVTITPPQIQVPKGRFLSIDGSLDQGEWDGAATFGLENGTISFLHDLDRLYILINMFGDDFEDPFSMGGGDQFWLYFDINEDGVITPDVDLRLRLESGTGNLRKQTFCDGCTFVFNSLQAQTFSARGEGFGCFFADGTFEILPLSCNSHRLWELALDLAELEIDSDSTARFGFLVSSGSPMYTENFPANLNDMSSYAMLNLLDDVRGPGSGPGAMNPQFEVTQAVQTPDNALDLIAGKQTAVRIWDESNDHLVKNYVFGAQNGIDMPGSPLLDVNSLSYETLDIDRDSIAWNSFSVLPVSWTEGGTVEFDVVVKGRDNSIAANLTASVDFVPTRTPIFWTVPVSNNFPNGSVIQPQANRITVAEQWLQQMAPIQGISIIRRPPLTVNNITSSAGMKDALKNYDMLTSLVWILSVAETGFPPYVLPEQITGFTGSGFGTTSGSSDRVGKGGAGRITWVQQSTSSVSMTYAHELNHNLDRAATSTWGLHSRGCNAQAGGALDPSWPYGTNFNIQETGVSPVETSFASVNAQTPDFMSYCTSSISGVAQWWSPYRWQAWVDEFRLAGSLLSTSGSNPVPVESFYIQGRVYPNDSGELAEVLREPGLPEPAVMSGDYTVRVLDCGTSILAETSFNASFSGDEGEEEEFVTFTMVLPAPASSCSIELSLNDVVLQSQVISANPPTVALLAPNGGELWTGMETVSWTASDPDDDPLQYSLLFSDDDGMTWQPIAGMIHSTSYEMDSTQWPGTFQAKIRVLASDGANTSHDDADQAFAVLGKAPAVEILMPQDGTTISASHGVGLSGVARDTSGNTIASENLFWSVDGITVGMGGILPVYFDEGPHDIVLDVMEGESVVATTSIQVTAKDVPGVFGFDNVEYFVGETEGEIALTVTRSGGAAGIATLLFETMDGTAISGGSPEAGEDDYLPIPTGPANRLEWADGDASSRSITIIINPDQFIEEEEQFQVLLNAHDGEQLDTAVAIVRINTGNMEVIFSDGFE